MSRDFHFYKLSSNTASWTADNLKISHCTQFISGFEGRVFTNFENASRIARARVGEMSWWATDQHHSKISKCSVRSHRSRGSWGERPDRSREAGPGKGWERSAGGQRTGLTTAAHLRLLLRKTQFPKSRFLKMP